MVLNERGGDIPSSPKSESGSAHSLDTSLIGGSVLQTDAADLMRIDTSAIDGRRARWVSQQFCSNIHTSLERPSSVAFAGFEGLSPPKTITGKVCLGKLPKGIVPVRTYAGEIDSTRSL